jgi:hypothetical protein
MGSLKYLIATCALAITFGTANASTSFDWSFTSDYSYISGSGALIATSEGGGQYAIDSISGQVTFGDGFGVGCWTTLCVPHYDSTNGLLAYGTTYASRVTFGDNQVFYPAAPSLDTFGIAFAIYNSLYPVDTSVYIYYSTVAFGGPGYVLDLSNEPSYRVYFDLSLSQDSTTPLPGALPLFASGLGALGLLGWRTKRKAQATA